MNKNDIHSAAQTLGKLGGLAKSAAKATAVRENGKLGGRPVGSKDTKQRKHRKVKAMRNPTTLFAIALSLVSREVA
jgi:hypothetical protein